jgi:hypothetical protein
LTAKISVAPGAAESGIVIRGATSQSANLQEWQNVGTTPVASVSPSGVLTATTFSGSGASLTSIPNSALVNSSITIGSTTISLGGTAATNLNSVTINGTTIPSSVTLARRDAAQTFTGTQTFSSTISGNITGNAATVNNGVYTTGDQTIGGTKTFSSALISTYNGTWGTPNIVLNGEQPSIRFADAGQQDAHIGINDNTFYILGDTDSNGAFDTVPFSVNLAGGGMSTSGTFNSAGNIVAPSTDIGGGFTGASGTTINTNGIFSNKQVYSLSTGYFAGTLETSSAFSATGVITGGNNITYSGKAASTSEQVTGYHLNQAGWILASRTGGTPLLAHRWGQTGGVSVSMVQFIYNGSVNGTVNVASGGTPAFASGSDYRMKTEITPISDAIERMKNAKAYTFYKIDEVDPSDTLHTGFLAHELAEVQPDAVLGEKDAVDEGGDPIYQEVMEAKIIPVMAQAINDLIGMVETLTARIEALEA